MAGKSSLSQSLVSTCCSSRSEKIVSGDEESLCQALMVGAIIFGLLLLFLCIEHLRGNQALRSRLKELTAKGEKLGIAELSANLDHYRMTTDYKHGMHFTALPTAWVSGFDKDATLRIGLSTALGDGSSACDGGVSEVQG